MQELRERNRLKNATAISQLEIYFGKAKEAFESKLNDPVGLIGILRLHGYGCAECGERPVSVNALESAGYGPDALCTGCTKENVCPVCNRNVLTCEDNKCDDGSCESLVAENKYDVEERTKELTA